MKLGVALSAVGFSTHNLTCAAGPMSIARLTSGSEVTRQTITKHLHVKAALER